MLTSARVLTIVLTRCTLLSPLHETMAARGAFFGVAAGWERPLFFLPEAEAGDLRPRAEYDWYGH